MPRLDNKLTKKEKEQYNRSFDTSRIYMAEVMDTRSVSRSGDIMVYLIGSGKDKKDSRNWIHASYASNLYGTTPYGANSNPSYEKDPQSFGAWFPMPCVGNYVFVFFPITSVENISCYWFACPVNPFTNYMLPGIPGSFSDSKHKPLCERNDRCSNVSNKSNSNSSVNENTVEGNTVEKGDIADDETIGKLIKDNNISQQDMQTIVTKMNQMGMVSSSDIASAKSDISSAIANNTDNITTLSNFLKSNTSLGGNNINVAKNMIQAYNNGTLTMENVQQFYDTYGNIEDYDFSESNGDNSGGCSNNIAKQKRFFTDLAGSESKQAEYTPMSEALKRQGLEKDDVRGYSTAGSKRESPSMCYGIKTPLGNSFVMDDGWLEEDKKRNSWTWNALQSESSDNANVNSLRQLVGESDGKSPWQREPNKGNDKRKNAGFRFRTRNGTQILIADEGTIFMINNDGSCWVEMTKNGFLEGYSKKGVSIASDGDINLHSKKSIYIECEETLAMKAKKINIETIAGNGSDSSGSKVGGDINIKNVGHINTEAVINGKEINTEKGKINTFETKKCKAIGELAGVFFGNAKTGNVPGMPEDKDIDIPEIKPFELKDPIEEEKVDTDGQGTSESDNKKTEKTINTKVPTHEPYFGHCKTCVKKGSSESSDEDKDDENENENNESDENKDSKNSNAAELKGNCNGCNASTGCCGNSNAPVTSCTGCGGVTNQCNKSGLNSIPQSTNTTCPNKKLSDYFSLPQLCYSETATSKGISNIPNNSSIEQNLQALAKNILDPIKKRFGNVNINSGYRSEDLNTEVSGSTNSQHIYGQAVDIEVPGVSNIELAQWIKNNLQFDQLILENATDLNNNKNSGWVHVSYSRSNNRKQTLTSKDNVTQNGLIG